jgi:hypothetical protein
MGRVWPAEAERRPFGSRKSTDHEKRQPFTSDHFITLVVTYGRKPVQVALVCLLCAPCLSTWAQTTSQKAPPVASPGEDQVKAEFHQIMRQLPNPYGDPICFAGAGSLLKRAWELAGEWVTSYLDEHPAASVDALLARIATLSFQPEWWWPAHSEHHESLTMSAVQLRGGQRAAYVVAVNVESAGTFFVVARRADGHYRVVWSVNDFAEQHPQPHELSAWAYHFPDNDRFPVVGAVHTLPDRGGTPRFYVSGETNCTAGAVERWQISIWEWQGEQVVLLFIGDYSAHMDSAGVSLQGDLLRLHTKEFLKVINPLCGGCVEPSGVWTLRLTPTGVEDLGHVTEDPLWQLIDELLDRTQRGENVSALAAHQVAADLRASFASGGEFEGLVEDWRHTNEPHGDHLEVDIVGSCGGPCELSLNIKRRNGKLYVASGSVRPCAQFAACRTPTPMVANERDRVAH